MRFVKGLIVMKFTRCQMLLAVACWSLGVVPLGASWLPQPPMQDEPWESDGGELAGVVEKAFSFGLADPRGCEYRHVRVREGGELKEARAWVLPESGEHDGRFAIGWNGLIFRVENVGGAADLMADMKLLADRGTFQQEDPPNLQEDYGIDFLFSCYRRNPRISSAWAAPFLVARLGHGIGKIGQRDARGANPFAADDPFAPDGAIGLREWDEIEWLAEWSLLNRADAYAAFIEGEWAICVSRAQAFERAWKRAGELIARNNKDLEPRDRDGVIEDPFGVWPDDGWREPLVELSGDFAELALDARRRIGRQPERVDVGQASLDQLIGSWDEIESFDLGEPPDSFRRVLGFGVGVIPELLQRLRRDERFTRIVYRTGTDYDARLLRVRDLLILAIERILAFPVLPQAEIPHYGWKPDTEWYHQQFDRLGQFNDRYANLRGAKLWHRVLADDAAEVEHRWVAALALTSPVRKDWIGTPGWCFAYRGSGYCVGGYHYAFDVCDTGEVMAGEIVRGKVQPSVEAAFLRAYRAACVDAEQEERENPPDPTFFPVTPGQTSPPFPGRGPHQFLERLMEWNPQSRMLPAREHYDWLAAMVISKLKRAGEWNSFSLYDRAITLNEALMMRIHHPDRATDADLESDYVDLVEAYLLGGMLAWIPLRPLLDLSGDQHIDRLAEKLFTDAGATLAFGSSWSATFPRDPVLQQNGTLLSFGPYRASVLAGLRNQDDQAELTVHEDGFRLRWIGDPEQVEKGYASGEQAGRPAPGTKRQIRVCDLVANALAQMYDFDAELPIEKPEGFDIEAPRAERDAAISEWIEVIGGLDEPS